MKRLLCVIPFVVLIAGCASTAVPLNEAKTVQPKSHAEQTAEDSVKVTVVRDTGFFGAGCTFRFYYKDQLVAALETGEKTTFYLPPGEYPLHGDSCNKYSDESSVFLNVKQGDDVVIRSRYAQGGALSIQRIQ